MYILTWNVLFDIVTHNIHSVNMSRIWRGQIHEQRPRERMKKTEMTRMIWVSMATAMTQSMPLRKQRIVTREVLRTISLQKKGYTAGKIEECKTRKAYRCGIKNSRFHENPGFLFIISFFFFLFCFFFNVVVHFFIIPGVSFNGMELACAGIAHE